MRYEALLAQVRELPVIESQTLRALGDEPRSLGVQLSRWVGAGKLEQLRRGIYLLPPGLRSREPAPLYLANVLARPSYVSLECALAFHGMIPERVSLVQSVTTGRPIFLKTPAGEFQYRHVNRDWFFGYREYSGALVAEPEKALLDLIHLLGAPPTAEWFESLRLARLDRIDLRKLEKMAARGSRRVHSALPEVASWIEREASEGVAL